MQHVPEQAEERAAIERSRVLVARLEGLGADRLEPIGPDAEGPERGREAQRALEVIEEPGRVVAAPRSLQDAQGVRRGGAIEAERIGQKRRVRACVRGPPGAAEDVRELVVQPHARAPDCAGGERRAPERDAATPDVGRGARHGADAVDQRLEAGLGRAARFGARVRGVERLHAMGEGVEQAVDRQGAVEVEREPWIVDDEPRPHPVVAPGGLSTVARDAPDVRALGPRVRRGHSGDLHGQLERDGLGDADGRPSAVGEHPVDPSLAGASHGRVGDLTGDLRLARQEDAGRPVPQLCREALGALCVAILCNQQDAPRAELREQAGDRALGASSEDHAVRTRGQLLHVAQLLFFWTDARKPRTSAAGSL
jgi:hypothetical protein